MANMKNFHDLNQAVGDVEFPNTQENLQRAVQTARDILSIAESVPNDYAVSYNRVKVTAYDSDDQPVDVTPEDSLTVPESVVSQAKSAANTLFQGLDNLLGTLVGATTTMSAKRLKYDGELFSSIPLNGEFSAQNIHVRLFGKLFTGTEAEVGQEDMLKDEVFIQDPWVDIEYLSPQAESDNDGWIAVLSPFSGINVFFLAWSEGTTLKYFIVAFNGSSFATTSLFQASRTQTWEQDVQLAFPLKVCNLSKQQIAAALQAIIQQVGVPTAQAADMMACFSLLYSGRIIRMETDQDPAEITVETISPRVIIEYDHIRDVVDEINSL